MDRREALKKLGVGTAIAVSAPALLPSTRVAYAASGGIGQTGLVGVPLAGDPVPWNRTYDAANSWREVKFHFDNSSVSCADGSAPEFSVQWRIVSVSFAKRNGWKRIRMTSVRGDANVPYHQSYPAGYELASSPLVKTTYSGGGYGAVAYSTTFLMRNRYEWGEKKDQDGYVDGSTSYVVGARCRWHCPGASTDVVAEYQFSGSALGTPSTVNVSWDDQAPA